MTHELRGHAFDVRQLLALVPVFHLRCRVGAHSHFGRTRGTETALDQRHDLALLHRPAQYLAHGLAFTQHIDFKADRHFGLDRPDKGDRQRTYRTIRRHLGAHGFVLQSGHQAPEAGPPLRPFGRDRQLARLAADGVEQIGKAHGNLKNGKRMQGS
ncbi:hypothetical protein D3C87_1249050 [compost metagenome]